MKSYGVATAAGLVSAVVGETIHGVTVFTRHGDRKLPLVSDKKTTNENPLLGNSKHYSGYQLSPLGITENFEVGSDYRDLYIAAGSQKQILGISDSKYVPSQVYASAPDQQVCWS